MPLHQHAWLRSRRVCAIEFGYRLSNVSTASGTLPCDKQSSAAKFVNCSA